MRLRGLGHLPRVRGREEAFLPSEAAVRVGEATTQSSSRVWAAFSARYTNPKSALSRGRLRRPAWFVELPHLSRQS